MEPIQLPSRWSAAETSAIRLESSSSIPYTERMKNKEHRINGAINTGVSVRAGEHEYEEGHPEVVEIAFKGYNSTYIQVIDMKTAKELKDQLDFIL
jgi:hypothetical protein